LKSFTKVSTHHNLGKPNVSKTELRDLISKKYSWDAKNLVLFGFRTAFGGNRTIGFCYCYDTHQYLVKFAPEFQLRRMAMIPKRNPKRRAEK
jgi:small subunit ribosomal protein S24e